MRHPAVPAYTILLIALLLLGLSLAALWHASLVIASTVLAVYHIVIQFCAHPFRPNRSEGLSIIGITVFCGLIVVSGRFAWAAARRLQHTRGRITDLLATRALTWPAMAATVAAQLGCTEDLDVIDGQSPIAFCHGFLQPRICISTGLVQLLQPAELAAVLLHEEHHRRNRDPLKILLTGAVVQALFFLPTLRDLERRYDIAKEFAADGAAVAYYGRVGPMAGALYKVLSCPLSCPDLRTVAVGGLTVTEHRIDHLLAPEATDVPGLSATHLVHSGAALVMILLLVLTLDMVHVQPVLTGCRF